MNVVRQTSHGFLLSHVRFRGAGHPYVLPHLAHGLDYQRDTVVGGPLPALWCRPEESEHRTHSGRERVIASECFR